MLARSLFKTVRSTSAHVNALMPMLLATCSCCGWKRSNYTCLLVFCSNGSEMLHVKKLATAIVWFFERWKKGDEPVFNLGYLLCLGVMGCFWDYLSRPNATPDLSRKWRDKQKTTRRRDKTPSRKQLLKWAQQTGKFKRCCFSARFIQNRRQTIQT